jgi:hypothetical protein
MAVVSVRICCDADFRRVVRGAVLVLGLSLSLSLSLSVYILGARSTLQLQLRAPPEHCLIGSTRRPWALGQSPVKS